MTSHVVWYAARASGFVAWGLAAASVVWGLALSSRALGPKPRPAWLFDLHRFLGGMAVIFTGVHVASILLDTYTQFGVVNVLVPLTGTWHPLAVAWGIVGLYALLAVELTSLFRTRISRAVWRRVHFAGFVLFVVTTVHALAAGTDARSRPFVMIVVATCVTVALLTGMRIARSLRQSRTSPPVRQPRTSQPQREMELRFAQR